MDTSNSSYLNLLFNSRHFISSGRFVVGRWARLLTNELLVMLLTICIPCGNEGLSALHAMDHLAAYMRIFHYSAYNKSIFPQWIHQGVLHKQYPSLLTIETPWRTLWQIGAIPMLTNTKSGLFVIPQQPE